MPIDPKSVKWDAPDASQVQWDDAPVTDGYEFPRAVGGAVRDLLSGGVRGAGSIGATLLRPFESAQENAERRTKMDQALTSLVGADPSSIAYGAGKIGAEIAGTAGIGGAIAKPVGAVLSRVAPSAAPAIVQALRTGGMSTGANPVGLAARAGDLGLRSAAGTAVGGASAAAVDPDSAGLGALIGGAIPLVGAGIRNVAMPMIRQASGAATGVGEAALGQAYRAGKTGGQVADDFAGAMRGKTSMDDALAAAKENLAAMGAQRREAYLKGMERIKSDKEVLDMTGILDSVANAKNMISFKGVAKNPQAAAALDKVAEDVAKWNALNRSEYHTPEGLDALKQVIGAHLESLPFEQKTARAAIGNVYSAIKSEIKKNAGTYEQTMRDYSEASDLIKEIERALLGNQRTAADTAMRKLQSLMRNNVNTNYGYRDQLMAQLEQAGGREVMPMLAGQAVNSWVPRGLQRAGAGLGGLGFVATGNIPAAVTMAAGTSPRLAGEAAFAAGKFANSPASEALRRALTLAAPVAGAQ